MSWLDKLERKFGRYAVSNMILYFIGATLIGSVISMMPLGATLISYMQFDAYSILHGQIWRLVTWMFSPAPTGNILLSLLFYYCLFHMGRSLEGIMGTFRVNIYLIGGIIISDIGGLLIYLVFHLPIYLSVYHILLTVFMALAICIPDGTVNLYFILPIKMKWMLAVYLVELVYELYVYFSRGGVLLGIVMGSEIIFALINFAFFFFFISKSHVSLKQKKRRKEFQAQMREPRPGSGITKHKCAVCGVTEKDDPTLEFRFCSKCEGNYEYCQHHLFTHQHIKRS